MPNWVMTVVEFEGKQANINNVLKEISSKCANADQEVFDFNKLIPMPESLNIVSGARSNLAYAYYMATKFNQLPAGSYERNIQDVIDQVEKDATTSPVEMLRLGKTMADNIENYGAKDWYDWCCRNWGTKWNACNCSRDGQTLVFSTAWSWPEPIMIKLAELCSRYDVRFDGKWADEDCGCNTGTFSGDEGLLCYGYCDDCSSEAYETYVACWGESDCIGIDTDGQYYHYECGKSCPNYTLCYGDGIEDTPATSDNLTPGDEDLTGLAETSGADDTLTAFLSDFNRKDDE